MLKLGILISGRGSNMQALLDACAHPEFPAKVAIVIANKAEAAGLPRAAEAGIATAVVPHKDYATREAFEAAVDAALRAAAVDLVCLAGFMRVLTPWFVQRWQNKLINIHPSLLPKYPGLETHERALAAGDKEAGCTVHAVSAALDAGPIVVQAAVPVLDGDDVATLAARVLTVEHLAYPFAVRLLATGQAKIANNQIVFANNIRWPVWARIMVNRDDVVQA